MGGESQSRSTLVCVLRGYQMAKEEELGEDFSYLIRIANTDIDGLKALKTALTSIRGVGNRTAIQICHQVNIPPSTRRFSIQRTTRSTQRNLGNIQSKRPRVDVEQAKRSRKWR